MFGLKIEVYVRVQTLIAACLYLGELINGYGVAFSAPVLPKLDDPSQSPLPYRITETQKSWIASVMFFGCVGAYLSGFLSNKIGRKRTIIIGGVLNLMSYLILTFAKNLAMMYVGRFFIGISMSNISVIGLIYIGEIVSTNIRGIILTCMGVFHALGSLLVYSVGPFLDYAGVGYVNIGLTVIYIGACSFLPESPMYYAIKEDEYSARDALLYLGRSVDINTELKAMMDKVEEQKSNKHVWKELIAEKSNRKSLFVSVFLSFFQQSSGIIAVIFYANTIFRYAGSSVQPDIASIIVGVTFVLGTIVAPMFIEKYGRRLLLIVSTAGLCAAMTLLGVYFYLRLTNYSSVKDLGWIPLTLLIFAQLFYSFGLSIIPNTISGELFTPKVRGLGTSISLSSGWMSGFLSTTLFGYIIVGLGIHITFWLFAICNALALLFVILFVPETMGKTLMEIQETLKK